jgi:myo-inositol-1(or 4)-monophosphatase
MQNRSGDFVDHRNVGDATIIEDVARVGEEAARAAGKFLMENLHGGFKVTRKGEIDLVTEIDIAAERMIVSRIKAAFPDHGVLAEEMHSETASRGCTWIIDPLDGTTNYAHGFPVFSVSIGLEIAGVVEWGIVYNPNLEEVFVARRRGGAFLNGQPIRVSETELLGSSLLATGFPYDIRTSLQNNLDCFRAFSLCAQGIRRAGSAALDLCYLAAGRFDGFWEFKLNPWDVAPGYLIVREAGGSVTNHCGAFGSIYDRECLATNGRIHEQMMAVLRDTSARSSSAK